MPPTSPSTTAVAPPPCGWSGRERAAPCADTFAPGGGAWRCWGEPEHSPPVHTPTMGDSQSPPGDRALGMASAAHLFGCDGQILDAHPHGIIDGVGNGGGYRGDGVFADGFALVGALAAWRLHQHGDGGRDALHRRDLRLPR